MLREALGDLADAVEIESNDDPSTESPIDTPLWDSLSRASPAGWSRASALVPMLMIGGTDNRFFRRAGSVGYGFGLFSKRVDFEDYATMFHGNDERVDQESLACRSSSGRPSPTTSSTDDRGPSRQPVGLERLLRRREADLEAVAQRSPERELDELARRTHRRRPLDRRHDPRPAVDRLEVTCRQSSSRRTAPRVTVRWGGEYSTCSLTAVDGLPRLPGRASTRRGGHRSRAARPS